MDFNFSEEQQMIEDHAREFAQRVIAPGAAHRDETSTFDRQLLSQLAENGFLGMLVPEAYGGSAMGYTSYVLVNRQLATACASTAVITGVCNLTASAIDEFGSEDLKKDILPEICRCTQSHRSSRGGRVYPQRHQAVDHQWRDERLVFGDGSHRRRRQRYQCLYGSQGDTGARHWQERG